MDTSGEFNSRILELMERQSQTMDVHTMLLEKLIKQNQRTRAFLVPKKSAAGTEGSVGESGQPDDKLDVEDEVKLQKEAMEKMVKALESMEKKLESLEKNSNLDHDDQPFRHHELQTYEPAWRGVYETLSTTMKDKVERWKSGMDSSLIFVGLFVTIITAFLIPLSQNLAPNPSELTNDILTNLTTVIYEIAVLNGLKVPINLAHPVLFHPSLSDEIVSLLWYTALLLSLIAAIFSVFGRQWVEHLIKKPECQKYSEKSRRLNLRDELANKLLKPILDSLHPMLILSITFFIAGLLFQLWTISLTVDKSVTLMSTSIIGSVLILCAALLTLATVFHGGYCDESPFTMTTSATIRRLIPKRFLKEFNVEVEDKEYFHLFYTSIMQIDNHDSYDHASAARLFGFQWWDEESKPNLSFIARAIESVVHFLRSDASQKAKLTMAWNLLDLEKFEEVDYKKLKHTLWILEIDTPRSQEQVRLGFAFVRIVLLLRSNKMQVRVSCGDSYLNKMDIKKVFMAVLSIPNHYDEKYFAASQLAALAEEDSQFLNDVGAELLRLVLFDDGDPSTFWRSEILPHLPAIEIMELLWRISQESNISAFLFRILDLFLRDCHQPIDWHLLRKLDFYNLVSFLRGDTDRYTDIPGRYRSPTDVLLSCFALMDDVLLSRQRDLSSFLWTVARDADPVCHGKANALLDRLAAFRRLEN